MGKADLFAGRLKELRAAAGLSLKELAERAKITPDAIVKLESGNRKPGWETVIALSDALGVECSAFLQEPAPAAPVRPGRPRQPTAESSDQQEPKRRRGRPRKAPAVSQEEMPESKATGELAGQKKPAAGQGRKRKGK